MVMKNAPGESLLRQEKASTLIKVLGADHAQVYLRLAARPSPRTNRRLTRELLLSKDGAFAENIRASIGSDDTELRASLKQLGWVAEFPALVDEDGVVLVGHRRLMLAKQLKIEPVIKTLRLGHGDARRRRATESGDCFQRRRQAGRPRPTISTLT